MLEDPVETAKRLVVMIAAEIGGDKMIGAGIIVGADSDRLYIVTADHLVRRGKFGSQDISVQVRNGPVKGVAGRLLDKHDEDLDIAVIAVDRANKADIDINAIPFDWIGDPEFLKRGEPVFSIGYRNGHPWATNLTADRLSDNGGERLYFESSFVGAGQSGGALLNSANEIVGMILGDQPPEGAAISISKISLQLKKWNYPVLVARDIRFVSVSPAMGRPCGVGTDGYVYCWSRFVTIQQGPIVHLTSQWWTRPKRVFGMVSLSATYGYGRVCGITAEKAVYCWDRHAERLVNSNLDFESVSTGKAHTCGVTPKGAAFCWKYNDPDYDGFDSAFMRRALRLDSPGIDSTVPLVVKGGLTFESVSGGELHTCGRTPEGRAYCWGRNDRGQLGNGTTNDSLVPALVKANVTFGSVSAGESHTCGLTTEGRAYCWGRNDSGQLGNGTTNDSLVPALVKANVTFGSVSESDGHTCGLSAPGTVYCWGENDEGQLGNASNVNSPLPVPVAGDLTFKSLAAGNPSCGVATTGLIYCWGGASSTPVLMHGQVAADSSSVAPARRPSNFHHLQDANKPIGKWASGKGTSKNWVARSGALLTKQPLNLQAIPLDYTPRWTGIARR